jgi:tetratricopeptide (TPR) repeat protein
MVLEAFSVSHGKASAFLPVIELLHGYFDISAGDDERKRREKVTGRVLALDRSSEDTLPYLFSLLGIVEGEDPLAQMDGQIKKRRTLEAIKRILLRESLNQPLVVIFEDLHWIDEETLGFLNLLAESIGTARILMMVNYRPEYSHQWGSKTYYTQLRLDPLGRESADEMLTALVGDSASLARSAPGSLARSVAGEGQGEGAASQGEGADLSALKRLIIEKTEGNPFFMEEMFQVLLDEGSLVRDGAAVRLTKRLSELKIPPTVQAILAARIDRLPAAEKDLLQTLAVIGKEFQLSLVRAVLGTSADELSRMLDDLQVGEFIYEQPAVGDAEYVFKHALTQEVAYGSLLIERRTLLHERIGRAIEANSAASIDDHVSELAYHFGRSAATDRAVFYLGRGADRAIARGAFEQARDFAIRALEALARVPEGRERTQHEIGLQIALGEILTTTQGMASLDGERAFDRARDLCVALGDDARLLPALAGLQLSYALRGKLAIAKELALQLLQLAKKSGGEGGGTLDLLANTLWWRGEYRLSNDRAEARIATGDRSKVDCFYLSAWALWALGYPEKATTRCREALAAVRQYEAAPLRHSAPFVTVLVLYGLAHCKFLARDVAGTRRDAETLISLADEHGFAQHSAQGHMLRGWALVHSGEPEVGLAEIDRGISAYQATGAHVAGFYAAIQAESRGLNGKSANALELIEEALADIGQNEERGAIPELLRLKGELLERASQPDQADQSFRQAIAEANDQEAKSFELRATMSLARLLDRTGRRDEARTMLAEIYNWFTEGFDTTDLKDAKSLLDELRVGR